MKSYVLLFAIIVGTSAGACALGRAMPPAVARQLEQLAGELCVEGDSVSVCARKCAEAEPPTAASSTP